MTVVLKSFFFNILKSKSLTQLTITQYSDAHIRARTHTRTHIRKVPFIQMSHPLKDLRSGNRDKAV